MIQTSSKTCIDSHYFLTSLPEAIEEIHRRRADPALEKKIETYLAGDIPEYFRNDPILYLARHVATPNYETLRFLELCKSYDLPAYIGLDINDKFVPINPLKKALGKMSIATEEQKNGSAGVETITIIDFNTTQGKKLKDITTLWGQKLTDFHTELFEHVYGGPVNIIDDSEWIDRNHRGNLIEHYRKFLPLLIVHGIMLELYEPADSDFVQDILCPSYEYVEKQFGYRPLIADLVPDELKQEHNWESYPPEVLAIVKNKMQ